MIPPLPLWVLTGTVAVVGRVVMSPYQKYLLADSSEAEVLFVRDTVALLLFVPTVAWLLLSEGFSGAPVGTVAMLSTGFLNVVGAFVVFRALNREDASVVVPLMSLSPVVTSAVEPLLRNTVVPPTVVVGSVLSAAGAAVVTSEQNKLQSIVRSSDTEAVVLALSANIIFGVTSTLDGIATASVHPLYVSATIVLFVCAGTTLRLHRQSSRGFTEQRERLSTLYRRDKGVLGVVQFVGLGATLVTFGVAPSATQAAILFKSNIVLVVLVSSVGLQEQHLLRRSVGATIISAGVVLAVTN
ncbi:MAG: integral membrane protein DUF6 [halophilic archaeon J07HX64]|nr:MAG: integral membrane protein DUF6 [halophilic archaeon J07HX64]